MPPFRTMLVCVLLLCGSVSAAEFTVSDWSLVIGVDPDGASPDVAIFNVVENPFSDSHRTAVGVSGTSASYNFAWGEMGGQLLMECTQQAEGLGDGYLFTSASGRIYITALEDLTVHVDASFDYNLPADLMMADLMVSVGSPDYPEYGFSGGGAAMTLPGMPSSGTLTTEDELVLYAGSQWLLYYSMALDTSDAPTDRFATGTGRVAFTITPEPSTLGLLACGSLMLLRRRRA